MSSFKLPSIPASGANTELQSGVDTPPLAYHIPFWSERPPDAFQYQLEVIFQGSIQQVIALGLKPFYLIGRLPFCDIVIDNDSVSRQHAIIQFRKNGEAFLYDLGSTHGTILNGGAPINPNAYKRLMAGDSIKFGSSSRTFMFEGGPDREEVIEAKPTEKSDLVRAASASALSGPSDASKPKSAPVGTVVTKPKRRFAPLMSDKDENEELDAEGRLEAQLLTHKRANHNNEDEDDGNVSDEERNHAELEMVAGFLGREAIEGADEDDSFFDRTLEQRKTSLMEGRNRKKSLPESHETVSSKLRVLSFVIGAVVERISALNRIIEKDEHRRGGNVPAEGEDGTEVDALDAFLNGMSQTVEEEEERAKKQIVLNTLEAERVKLKELETQLKPGPGEIHATIVSAADLELLSDQYYNDLVERAIREGGPLKLQMKHAAPPEPKRAKLAEMSLSSSSSAHSYDRHINNVPSKPIEARPTPNGSTQTGVLPSTEVPPSGGLAPRAMNPPSFPLPSVPITSDSLKVQPSQTQGTTPSNPKKRDRPTPTEDEYPNAEAVWEAPQGQVGDGRTALNDKYGY